MSILASTDKLVDDWLAIPAKGKPPHYRHRSAALELSSRTTPITGTRAFLDACYAQIHRNWLAAIEAGYSKPSRENWRWEPQLKLTTSSPEVQLERAIVTEYVGHWCNQVPTASGLVDPYSGKRAAVDLVFRHGPTAYSLVELKVGSDNPLFAAIEVLMYGLLFVWSRNHVEQLDYDLRAQPILAATEIKLVVLAPPEYYRRYKLANLATALDSALSDFGAEKGLRLNFEFSELGASFEPELTSEWTRSAIDNRRPIWTAGEAPDLRT